MNLQALYSAHARAFTLLEFLASAAVAAILASLALMAASSARASARRSACLNHLKQIGLAMRMYADDMNDLGPSTLSRGKTLDAWTVYRELLKNYAGVRGEDRLFMCPDDSYHYNFTAASQKAYAWINEPVHRQAWSEYSSYAFNGGNSRTNASTGAAYPGLAGVKLSAVREPSRTILAAEYPAFFPFSWHAPRNPKVPHYFDKARNMAGFVDGHAAFIEIFHDPRRGQAESWQYDPPRSYNYKWSANE